VFQHLLNIESALGRNGDDGGLFSDGLLGEAFDGFELLLALFLALE